MNKMLVAVFDSETQAFEGLSALKELHGSGDISLYSTAVFVKDGEGKIEVKQSADRGPVGAGVGLLTGSLVGLLAGPIGMAVGASIGGLTGMLADMGKTGIDFDFADEVAKAMTPGKWVVLADVQEGWTTPVDTRIEEQGGMVFRRLRSEVIEDQMAREAAALDAELQELNAEWKEAGDEAKAKIKKHIDESKMKLQAIHDGAEKRIADAKAEMDAKAAALQQQMKDARDRKKAKLERRMEELRADLQSRTAKLKKAGEMAKEALSA